MDSIGGSALTLLVACVSSAASHLDQTLSTLSYAHKAKNIRNKPVVQVDHGDAEVLALQVRRHSSRYVPVGNDTRVKPLRVLEGR